MSDEPVDTMTPSWNDYEYRRLERRLRNRPTWVWYSWIWLCAMIVGATMGVARLLR